MVIIEGLKFHHIGYAVKSIDETANFYVSKGWTLSEETIDPIQNTKIAFLKRDGFPLMELVAPVDETSPIVKTLDKVGVSTYHVCYGVNDLEDVVKQLRKEKFLPLFKPVPANALDNKRICYLYNAIVGLIELVEN